jgi:excisionase family DNA binding protein
MGNKRKEALRKLVELARGMGEFLSAYAEACEEEEEEERRASARKEEASGYMTLKEAAAYMTVSVSSLNREVAEKRVPHCKIRNRVVFSRERIDQFMREKAALTEGELCGKADAPLNRRRKRRTAV